MTTQVANINVGLEQEVRRSVAELLNALVADEMLLFIKTKNFHWNVKGPHFREYHAMFDEQAAQIQGIIDDAAERVRALDEHAVGTMNEYQSLTHLQEHQGFGLGGDDMVAVLLSDHEALIRQLRHDIEVCSDLGDEGNTDFLTGIMEMHEKTAWMLRATLG